jgi:hypothetical protein
MTEVPTLACWLLLLEAKSSRLRAHLQAFLLCRLIEDYLITRSNQQFNLRTTLFSPQTLFKKELLHLVDTLVDTSELSHASKHLLIADLETEADIQRTLVWSVLKCSKLEETHFLGIFSKDLFRKVVLTPMMELGLTLNYIQRYFGIKFKAGFLKSINNDKYFLMLQPSLRNLEVEDAFGPLIGFHETLGIVPYGENSLNNLLKFKLDPSKLDHELLSLEHIVNYTKCFSNASTYLVGLLTLKSLSEALEARSMNYGRPWADKAMSLISSSPM